MKGFTLLQLMVFALFSVFSYSKNQPNFIFILTDDQPYDYMGCVGNKLINTPNLDQLAKEGVLFTNAHVTSAICTPSRVSILLSQFERKHGVNFNSGTSISENAWEESYPVLMREAGYYTGWIGKNHSPIARGGYESGVMEKSFDYWYGAHKHLKFYPKKIHKIFNGAKSDTQIEIIQEGVDDFLNPNERNLKGAIRFLDKRPEEKPFVLSICFNLPHDAGTQDMKLKATDDDLYKTVYRDIDIPLPDNYIAKNDIETPKLPKDLFKVENRQLSYDYVNTQKKVKERLVRVYQAMTGIDRLVGSLRARLKKLNLDKNTVLVFTSDHGLFMGQYGIGGKALCYEVTTHVPLIIFDPNASKESKGRKTDALVQTIDIAPMMLSMAGIETPDSYQGEDISNLVRNKRADKVRDFIYTENLWSNSFGNPRCEAIQNKEWKYIRYYRNNNISSLESVKIANLVGAPRVNMLYNIYDPGIAVYRSYIEAPLQGETPVYEELYNLQKDSKESVNLIHEKKYSKKLNEMRAAWSKAIKNARGNEVPKVERYTTDSKREEMDE